MDLFTPVYPSPLISTSAIVLALVALILAAVVLASRHRGHHIWRHR